MLRIKVNNKFLELTKNAAIEMQLNSPLFLSDDVYSDFSYNLQIPYSEINVQILGDIFFEEARLADWYDCEVYDNLHFLFNCKLVIDKPNVNTRNRGHGSVEGYLLGGLGNFFYNIKNQKLCQLKLGGERSFPFTTWSPYDGSGGFWQHLHDTWNGNYDYVCLPFINEAAGKSVEDNVNAILGGWVNRLDFNNSYKDYVFSSGFDDLPILLWALSYGNISMHRDNILYIMDASGNNDVRMIPNFFPVVSIKVKFLLEQICSENGWTLDGSLLAGENFDKLILIGNTPIRFELNDDSSIGISTVVKFNLGDLISPDITCSDFIMQHCKRYGWYPKVNADTRTLQLIPFKNITVTNGTDWTIYADVNQSLDASAYDATQAVRRFSFKNNFPSGDSFPSAPQWNDYVIGQSVADAEQLPTPDPAYDNILIFCIKENAYYGIAFSDDLPITNPATQSRKWEWFCDNIYNEEETNNTDAFETNITPMPDYYTVYRIDSSGNQFYGSFLRCSVPQNNSWGIREVFYWGLVTERKLGLTKTKLDYPAQINEYLKTYGNIAKNLTAGTFKYPFASALPVLPDGTVKGKWANVYDVPTTASYKGIIDYWFSKWLKTNDNAITNTVNLNLPLYELANIDFSKIINIKNNPYLLQQLVLPVPYKGYAKAVLQPIILDKTVLQQDNLPYNGPIYLKAVWEFLTNSYNEKVNILDPFNKYIKSPYDITNVVKGCFKIYAYADKEASIAITPNNISVFLIKKTEYTKTTVAHDANVTDARQPFIININSPVTVISPNSLELYSYFLQDTGVAYGLNSAKNLNVQISYIIISNDYQLI